MPNETIKVSHNGGVQTMGSPAWQTLVDKAYIDLSGSNESRFAYAVPYPVEENAFDTGLVEVSGPLLVSLVQQSMKTELEYSMGVDFSNYPEFKVNGQYDCPTAKVMSIYAAYIRGEVVKHDAWVAGPEDLMVLLARSQYLQQAVNNAMAQAGYDNPQGYNSVPLIARGHSTIVKPNLSSCGLVNLGDGVVQPPPEGFTPAGFLGTDDKESSWMTYAGIAAAVGAAGAAVYFLRRKARRG